MRLYNLGSINIDHVYQVPHLAGAGETLAATGYRRLLGGKGANQSVAVSRAGCDVVHIGSVGADGGDLREMLREFGVSTAHVRTLKSPTGHAIIQVDAAGENAIVLFPGANVEQSAEHINEVLTGAERQDILLLQNETSLQPLAAQIAHQRGMRVVYSAAPFGVDAVRQVLPYLSVLMLNEGEAAQLRKDLGIAYSDLPVSRVLITKGKAGVELHIKQKPFVITYPAFEVDVIDTTGAGDTFAGYFAAGLAQGETNLDNLRRASAAAALCVTKSGTADSIPPRNLVDDFLRGR